VPSAARARQELLRGRRSQLDEAGGGLRPRRESRRCARTRHGARDVVPDEQADACPRARTRVRRRRRAGRLLRYRRRGAGGDVLALRGQAGPDSGDHRPLRGRGDRRAAGTPLFPSRPSASPRRKHSGSGSSTRSCRWTSSTPGSTSCWARCWSAARTRRARPSAHPRDRPSADRRRRDCGHGRAHRCRAFVQRRRRKASAAFSRQARAAWLPAALRKR